MALFTFWTGIDHTDMQRINGITIAKTTNIPLIASIMNTDKQKIQQRLDDGHQVWVATFGGTPVSFGWVSRGRVRIGELSKEVEIPASNAYLWNFRTLEYHRGLGYYPQLLHSILLDEQKSSDRIWIISAPENEASSRGIVKAGFQQVGELVFNYQNEVVLAVDHVDERVMAGANVMRVPITTSTTRPCWRCVSVTMNKDASCDCYDHGVPCRCGGNVNTLAKKQPIVTV